MVWRGALVVAAALAATVAAWSQSAELAVSELLFHPSSGEAEYVELRNTTDTSLDLASYRLVRVLADTLGRHYQLPSHTVPPGGYVVLTRDAASVAGCFRVLYSDRLLECQLPPFPDGGGSVVVARADSSIVDRFDYAPSMHSQLLRNKAGVSLERRSFAKATNAPGNWFSASSTSGYGTPGYENSQSDELLAEAVSFVPSAKVIVPGEEELAVAYVLDRSDLAARAEVYSRDGRVVRRLLNGGLMGAAGSVEWDGRGEDGTRLPQGQYLLQVTLYDLHGTTQRLRFVVALAGGL